MKLNNNLQPGSVLVLTLLMLLFLQFVAITVVNSTKVTSKVVRNYEISTGLKMASNRVINHFINNKNYFLNYDSYLNPDGKFEISPDTLISSDIGTTVISFKCLDPVSYDNPINCSLNNKYWQLVVQVEDFKTKASMRVEQGIHLGLAPSDTTDHSSDRTQKILLRPTWWYQL